MADFATYRHPRRGSPKKSGDITPKIGQTSSTPTTPRVIGTTTHITDIPPHLRNQVYLFDRGQVMHTRIIHMLNTLTNGECIHYINFQIYNCRYIIPMKVSWDHTTRGPNRQQREDHHPSWQLRTHHGNFGRMLGLPTFLLVEAIFTYPTLCAYILLGVDLQKFVIEIYIFNTDRHRNSLF
jgi:hypothetical protein